MQSISRTFAALPSWLLFILIVAPLSIRVSGLGETITLLGESVASLSMLCWLLWIYGCGLLSLDKLQPDNEPVSCRRMLNMSFIVSFIATVLLFFYSEKVTYQNENVVVNTHQPLIFLVLFVVAFFIHVYFASIALLAAQKQSKIEESLLSIYLQYLIAIIGVWTLRGKVLGSKME